MEVTREVVLDAPVEEVWDALTDPDRLEALKDDLAQRKALDLVTESAKPVAAEAEPAST